MIEKKRKIIKAFRVDDWTDKELREASQELDIKIPDLTRFLLVRSLKQLKEDAVKAGGYKMLEITLRKR